MAIKVKHEGNVTSRITAAGAGGSGKRAADDGKAWMQIAAGENQSGNRQLQGAHASPVSPGHASAQLIHAPTGAAPGITHAPSGAIHGPSSGSGLGSRGSGAGGSGGGSGTSRRLKVTGDRFFNKPDKESVWDWDSHQWIREYLPGEYEAEAQQRIGDVKMGQELEILDARHKQAMERAEQDSLLGRERDILGALLKLPPKPSASTPPIKAPFPNAPEGEKPPEQTPPVPEPKKPGTITITPVNPTIGSLREAILGAGGEALRGAGGADGNGLQNQFKSAMAAVEATLADARRKTGVSSPNPTTPNGSDALRALADSITGQNGGGSPNGAQTEDIGSVYARGGSIFGAQDGGGNDRPMSWLYPGADEIEDGGASPVSDEYASSIGGLINMFTRRRT